MVRDRILVLCFDRTGCEADCFTGLVEVLGNTFAAGADIATDTNNPPWDLAVVAGSAPRLGPAVAAIRQRSPETPILAVLCGIETGNPPFTDDFLCCPFQPIELAHRIRRLLPRRDRAGLDTCARRLRAQYRLEGLIGESPSLLSALAKLPPIAQSGATVLITGDTGTGKELFARGVHYLSLRSGMPFVPVNCAALPDHLFENELFGHARGAYTDASQDQNGLIQVAEGGTLLLDEVETLSLPAQAKVLRFLQNREYRPLGSARICVADVRIIAATNADLLPRVKAAQFREDLYHRLNVMRIHVPPLRDRLDDIPLLARYFAVRYAAQSGRRDIGLTQPALRKLASYSWPGNVRELESVIQRAVVLAGPDDLIRQDDIDLCTDSRRPEDLRAAKNAAVDDIERAYITELMTVHRGNVSQAAKSSGRQRRVLQRLIQKHGLDRDSFSL